MYKGIYQASNGDYEYQLSYSRQVGGGWEVDGVHLLWNGRLLFPKSSLPGQCVDAQAAITRGIGWCETVIDRLRSEDLTRESGFCAA